MNASSKTACRSLLSAALLLAIAAPSAALSSDVVAQLPKGDPARKLAVLHWQEVHLEEMVASTCYVEAGVDAEINRTIAYGARDAFEATLPDIIAEVAALDQTSAAVRHLKRKIDSKKDDWYRFRVFLEGALKNDKAEPEQLARLALLEESLVSGIEDVYRAVKRKAAKSGTVALADNITESAGFNRVFAASRLVKYTCLKMAGPGDALDREKFAAALDTMEKQLEVEENSLVTSAAVKELIPEWRLLMPRMRAALEADGQDDALLTEIKSLAQRWIDASGDPTAGFQQS
ncbi:MAG: hypothetical protein AAFR84_05930 [Pseudomonadota bacterium]